MLAVSPKLRGQGIASAMVKRFEVDAIEKDKIQALVLDTECVNIAALRLYNCKINSAWVFAVQKV